MQKSGNFYEKVAQINKTKPSSVLSRKRIVVMNIRDDECKVRTHKTIFLNFHT